jgi:hypothetical protein
VCFPGFHHLYILLLAHLPPVMKMERGDKQLRLRWCSAIALALLAFGEADGFLVDINYVESAVAKGAGQSHITSRFLASLSSALPVHPFTFFSFLLV